jgi:hypothetical protein
MGKRIQIIFLAMTLVAGISLLGDVLPFRISDIAYAYPRDGKNCAACHTSRGSSKGFTDSFMLEECHSFSSAGSNPYFVLEPGYQLVLEGKEERKNVQVTITVTGETKVFQKLLNIGGVDTDVTTRVVKERETWDGVLAEVSRNYFAICNRTNSVFYFGEDVDIYDDTGTNIIAHDGSWLATFGGFKPGIAM